MNNDNINNVELSILMPLYEGEEYLKETLQCILSQSFNNFELIILDNQSRDNSAKIVESFSLKDKRINYIYDNKMRNGNDCFNELIKHCNGEYVIVVNDDNYLHKDFFLNLLNNIKLKNSDLTICNGWYIDRDKNKKKIFFKKNSYLDDQPSLFKVLNFFIRGDVIPLLLPTIYLTKTFSKLLPYKNLSKFENDADTLMGIKILSNLKVNFLNNELFYCRIYDDHKRFHNSKIPTNKILYLIEKIRHNLCLIKEIFYEIKKSKLNMISKFMVFLILPFLLLIKRIKITMLIILKYFKS